MGGGGPFADRRAQAGARALGLPDDPRLAGLVPARERPRLFAALAAVAREGDAEEIRGSASPGSPGADGILGAPGS